MSASVCYVVSARNMIIGWRVVCVTKTEDAARKAVNGLFKQAEGRNELWRRYNHDGATYTQTVIHD